MCGIALTLLQRRSSDDAAAGDQRIQQLACVAEHTLRGRGPDSQLTRCVDFADGAVSQARNCADAHDGLGSSSGVLAAFTGAVLHLRVSCGCIAETSKVVGSRLTLTVTGVRCA